MNRQEMFNTVYAHIMSQGPAMANAKDVFGDEKMMCVYRGAKDDGTVLKCAAGLLIKDEFYSPSLENKPAEALSVTDALIKSGVDKEDIGFISSLQSSHDSAASPHRKVPVDFKVQYRENMISVSRRYELEMPA